ncbi:DNA polymerase/3'-5' exonuclease PolX (plasmid) [Methylocystis sp. MJC1]|uniref:DNA polymerase/3'-5' exonuclease PolX n=1 Tax=Methylocystis sp. MJC1 TaxID=2654282 RepID=UPI0013EC4817|nr:DNA polymerase/3'-5' exonuclease PolX [Methylocystis sp. MJC1]KAF2991474.1 DNA polymerase/3'-5' exonuclease PolX [Methylocystis sp. MJC1]MBU6529212.1 DNA polymerase/3'-5' exonuclease PolX [Methylocystis sp. MJC1]UZX13892.1 DNA polymerase/3'-5' exonuclease PolX [Methylocystis sp. MJC1]
MPVQNAEIASMFDQAAELLEIKGANPFRIRAYRRAARTIENLPTSVAAMLAAEQDLSDLPGVGEDLAEKIGSIVKAGRFDLLEELKQELPGKLVEFLTIPGIGPKRVKLLFEKLGVRSPEDLRRAAKRRRLQELRGFGAKLEQSIIAALDRPAPEKRRFKLFSAEAEARSLIESLERGKTFDRIIAAGSYRRRQETVGDLDILATARDGGAVGDRLVAYENTEKVLVHGPSRTTVILRSGLQVDLRVVAEESYGAALMYFTGSKAHNIALRNLANERGWKLNEYGLFDGQRRIAGGSEEETYKKLGLAFIPPELREDRGEVALAMDNALPTLVSVSDIRGDLHVHSDWSDGTASIADMADAAKTRGYTYMALTDHSQRVTVAHGLTAERIMRQIDEIDRLNAQYREFTILKGIEVDILADGRLDLPNRVLSRLDIVVASIHYKFDLPREKQTERLIRAMDNLCVSIIAHPTGRLIGEREPYAVDVERVLLAARDRNCFLEINAEPDRLDLNDAHAHAAKSFGVKLAISTDAHSLHGFDCMRFGVDQARRGWLGPDDVINTRPLRQLTKMLKRGA